VENSIRELENDEKMHTQEVSAIAINSQRNTVVSGSMGQTPTVFVWDA
jgi:hypothetical protein